MVWGKTGGKFPPAPGTTEPVQPVPDTYGPTVFPYRGSEQHGVPMDVQTTLQDQWVVDPVDAAEVLHEAPEHEPIPVRIVTESSREIKDWRTGQTVVTGSPSLIAGRNDRRSVVRIKNCSATVAVYVGNTLGVSTISGYPIAANGELAISTSEEVYGISADTTSVYVAVIQEVSVDG